MKHSWCQTPPSMTVRVRPNTSQSLQIRRGLRIQRANRQLSRATPRKSQKCHAKAAAHPYIVIEPQEMAAFFRLFDDNVMQDFLCKDSCYKLADKYLLAMTFVYFKRASFTIAEYTNRNFFIALYLANTMEEDDEESKYDIFPWALGKSWRKKFPLFLKQRDELWARIEYRAAVSRCCCDEVMAIVPSHFVWRRQRTEPHSGAQRRYGDQEHVRVPPEPSAPALCAVCDRGAGSTKAPRCSSHSSAQTRKPDFPRPRTLSLCLETTPSRAPRSLAKAKNQAPCCCCAEEAPRAESSSGSSYDTSMDWICEE